MNAPVLASVLAPLTLLALATVPSPAAAASDPLVGERSITAARGAVAPECLTVDSKHRVTVAALCFKEGEDHSWKVEPVPGAPTMYVFSRGTDCLTLDPTRVPHLLAQPCARNRTGQVWQVAPRDVDEYQIAQAGACIQARSGEADVAACRRGQDSLGKDDSGQAWKILKDPQSVVPDPTFGAGPERGPLRPAG